MKIDSSIHHFLSENSALRGWGVCACLIGNWVLTQSRNSKPYSSGPSSATFIFLSVAQFTQPEWEPPIGCIIHHTAVQPITSLMQLLGGPTFWLCRLCYRPENVGLYTEQLSSPPLPCIAVAFNQFVTGSIHIYIE